MRERFESPSHLEEIVNKQGETILKEKIRQYIVENKEALFKTIQEVVRIKSVVGNEQEMQAYMKGK